LNEQLPGTANESCSTKKQGRLPEIKKELLLDMVRQALETACFGDKIGVVLETLLDTP